MTKVNTPQKSFAHFASQMARNPETLRAFNEAMADVTRKGEIGQRMREERERRGLTQPQVAERAGLGSNASALRKYQNWEAGKHIPGHEQLERVAEALQVSYDYLVTGGEDSPPAKDILKRLDQTEEVLRGLEGRIEMLQNGQAELIGVASEVRSEQERLQRQEARGKRGRAKKDK